ncbi:hypothetical protein [Kordia zhangzhouensis]|uniref:hypothetical protein n=1 Tax=Kordia zhangzhouensis TaxID=1620405 RepID=UPI00138E4BB3|nr:hypothetical protein [Kordia zhangzhouensis]
MKTKIYFLLLAAFSTILFVSCNPDSIADEDNPYETQETIDPQKVKIPRHG